MQSETSAEKNLSLGSPVDNPGSLYRGETSVTVAMYQGKSAEEAATSYFYSMVQHTLEYLQDKVFWIWKFVAPGGVSTQLRHIQPFTSKMDWEIVRWAKLRGSGSTAFNALLAIEGVCDSLNLLYGNSVQLNKIIDELPTARPKFEHSEVVVNGESNPSYGITSYGIHSNTAKNRDMEWASMCSQILFTTYSNFIPYERFNVDKDKTIWMYHNMHTGKWWCSAQSRNILAQESSQSSFHPARPSSPSSKIKQPNLSTVYMMLGNIPKEIRRKPSCQAYILLGYLSTSRLKHIKNKSARCRILANVFHACMKYMLSPQKTAGVSGIPVASGDGVTRRGHPIYATFVGDYPEQCLVICTMTGDCPTCEAPRDNLGDDSIFPLRILDEILGALERLDQGPTQYQGVIKHLISWLKEACSEVEIDAHCRRLLPNHNIHLFMNGISDLNRVTGKEYDQIPRFLLGIILDIPLPNGISRDRLIAAVRGLLDFLNLAQYPMHTSETLQLQTDALQIFHENKSVFIKLDIRDDFNIPKIHYGVHYPMYLKLFGSSDN
ncbi:hypothetical protein DFH08DRAFT_820345 [Mycena albidolilacea]|uniref:Uncharacterized protein n=1 Tax=Mycena albidolilacea TaxID=1033008 RepID=A0AAD6ZDJ5_9AGAR|nr:hypothetical protein DFH08DRAFT_820345 [Mycena albidolilacea]